jgi:ABC-type dipeptide/oligopeptide/nickel transport system permease component
MLECFYAEGYIYNQYLRSVIPLADILHYCKNIVKWALGKEVYYHTSEVMNSIFKSFCDTILLLNEDFVNCQRN